MEVKYLKIFNDNYIWLIINEKLKMVVAVDPGDSLPLESFLRAYNYSLVAILVTHHHADHIGGISALKAEYNPNIYAPKLEQIKGVSCELQDGDKFFLTNIDCEVFVLGIPGHTLGHIAYYFGGMLFCGDTLFSAGCGRVFEGTYEQMFASLQKIASLPDETIVYCAHEYTLKNLEFALSVEPNNLNIKNKINEVLNLRSKNLPSLPTTIGEEKKINPFLRCSVPDIILHLESNFNLTIKSDVQAFKYLRILKDNF